MWVLIRWCIVLIEKLFCSYLQMLFYHFIIRFERDRQIGYLNSWPIGFRNPYII